VLSLRIQTGLLLLFLSGALNVSAQADETAIRLTQGSGDRGIGVQWYGRGLELALERTPGAMGQVLGKVTLKGTVPVEFVSACGLMHLQSRKLLYPDDGGYFEFPVTLDGPSTSVEISCVTDLGEIKMERLSIEVPDYARAIEEEIASSRIRVSTSSLASRQPASSTRTRGAGSGVPMTVSPARSSGPPVAGLFHSAGLPLFRDI